MVYQIFCPAIEGENSNPNNDDKDGIDLNNEIKDLEKNLEEWLQLRQETVYCPLISRISLLIFQFCVISRIFLLFLGVSIKRYRNLYRINP